MTALHSFDASSAECMVFVYKEGMLARMGHDLKIRVTQFRVEVDDSTWAIQARFDASSLRTVCAVANGTDVPGGLSAGDKQQIDQNISRDVLQADTYSGIAFTSSSVQERGDTHVVKGTLALHGKQRPLTVRVHREGLRWVGEARIHQPDFGIEPYTALLGTLKVKPDVNVRISLPARARSPRTKVASRGSPA